jgi:hypothetical protein
MPRSFTISISLYQPPSTPTKTRNQLFASSSAMRVYARGQTADLLSLRLDLRLLCQDRDDQAIAGKGEQGCAVHASP